MDSVQALLVIAACLVLSAFLSGSETVLLRVRTSDLVMHQLLRPVHVAFDMVVEPMVRWLGGGAESEHASTTVTMPDPPVIQAA